MSAQECNWTTTGKECWAVVYAFKKFEYLIRDIHFTLLTDHKNLIYIEQHPNDVVGHHGVQRTIERIMEERNLARRYHEREHNTSFESRDTRETYQDTRGTREISQDTRGTREQFRDTRGTPQDTRQSRGTRGGTREHLTSTTGEIVFPGGRTVSEILRPWSELREQVKRYVKRCACCQKMTYLKVPITTQ